MADFPTAQPGLKTDYDSNDQVASGDQNEPNDEINAIAAKLGHGTDDNSPAANKILRGTASGKSEWDFDIKDEDAMTSNSATALPTQQSVKAYVDSGTVTMTNKTLTSPVLNTGVSGTAVLDEDDLASDSNTQLATQQSIKAYVDSGTVTMTNKTLTSPVLTTPQVDVISEETGAAGVTIDGLKIKDSGLELGSDAQGDIFYRAANGSLARLGPGTSGQVLQSGGAGANPAWATATVSQAWSSYAPTWTASTNPAIGNGTLDGYYVQFGKTVHFKIRMQAGATTTFGNGDWSFSLPVTAKDTNYMAMGIAWGDDFGTGTYFGLVKMATTTTCQVWPSAAAANGWASATPHAWATTDKCHIIGTYEAA